VSLRTFNRNFEGRSGTKSAQVYLVSPEVAAASAIVGYIASPEDCEVIVDMPENFAVNDNMIAAPAPAGENVEIVRGPNIKPFPRGRALEAEVSGKVLIKLADNITTDHIMPSNSKLLPYRSNIPYLSDYCLAPCDDKFSSRAKENDGGFIVAGENYGQGSSREHAAQVPLYLGIKAVFAKSFARIHKANLINNGILPLVFENPADYDNIEAGDDLVINDTVEKIKDGHVIVNNITKNTSYTMSIDICEREQNMLLCGGLLNYTKQKVEEN
jgi:aconitate hydratase